MFGELVGLESALESGQVALVLSPLAAEPLSLRFGGEDVHLVFRMVFRLMSELSGHGFEVKLLGGAFERSGFSLKVVLCGEASGGCGSWLYLSILTVRGSGFIMLHMGSVVPSPSWDFSSMASVLKITLKCVFSEGVIVKVFGSDLSFLLTWTQQTTA